MKKKLYSSRLEWSKMYQHLQLHRVQMEPSGKAKKEMLQNLLYVIVQNDELSE